MAYMLLIVEPLGQRAARGADVGPTRRVRRSSPTGRSPRPKEMLRGFFLLDCRTLDEALAWAERCPASAWATVEVRETGPCFT